MMQLLLLETRINLSMSTVAVLYPELKFADSQGKRAQATSVFANIVLLLESVLHLLSYKHAYKAPFERGPVEYLASMLEPRESGSEIRRP